METLKSIALCSFMAASCGLFAQTESDPVIMTINGNPVSKSEFEYIYNKNNSANSIDKKTLDEYVDLFINFKLKVEEAKAQGAIGLFGDKYGEVVKVYTMGDFSKEICGGPHASNTGDLGEFVITKEQSSSSGVRRIKAELR